MSTVPHDSLAADQPTPTGAVTVRERSTTNQATPYVASWPPKPLAVGLLFVAVAAVFGQCVTFDFVDWDDRRHLIDNVYLLPPSWPGLAQFWTEPYDHLYIPLSYTWFAAQAWLSQWLAGAERLSPSVFHATSLALHIACVLLAWMLLRRLVRDDLAALFGALLFAIHPLQAESVAWVSEQRGLLSAALALGAMNLYFASGAANDCASGPNARGKRWYYPLATLLFVLSLLAKPNTAIVPALVALVSIAWLQTPWRRTLTSLAPWAFAAAAALIGAKLLQGNTELKFVPALGQRLWIMGDALGFYLNKLVWPLELGFDYGCSPQVVLASPQVYVTWLVPAILTMLAWASPARRAWLVCWGWMVLALAPVLGLVPFIYQEVSTTADRYMYMPLFGAALALALVIQRFHDVFVMSAAGACLGLLALLGFEQTATWTDNATLFNHGLEVNPASYTAHYNLAARYLMNEQTDEAEKELRQCLAANPDYAWAHNALGVVMAGRADRAGAIAEYRAALAIDANYADARGNLANALWQTGDRNAAIAEYRRAIESAPDNAAIRKNFARLLTEMGRSAESIEQLELAIAYRSGPMRRSERLAREAMQRQDWPQAAAHWRDVLTQQPTQIDALFGLALAQAKQGQRPEAIALWRKVQPHVPNDSLEGWVIAYHFETWGVPWHE